MAESRESLRVLVVPAYTKDLSRTLDALARIVPIPAADRDRVFRIMRRQSRYLPVLVVENLTWRQFALLNVLAPQLPGMRTDVGSFRIYNTPQPAAHVVGYVGMAGKGEVDEDPVMRVPGFRLGKTGLEKGFDRPLRGHAGSITSEVDAHGRIVRELGSVPSQPGKDLVLTLDHELQTIAYDRIASQRRGSLVVLDCNTGDVLVMVSVPSYNPNEIAFKPDPKRWAELVKHEDEPLNNRAVDGLYPPGSTFKVVNALAALAAGVVSPEERIVCKGGYLFGKHFFHCWKSHGPIALHDAIKSSCDVYFYETAHRMGIDKLAVTGRALGLGKAYDTELPGVKAGVMPDTAWKRAALRQPWYPGETISCAIGQGYVIASPLQLALVAGRIASGKAIFPRFVRSAGQTPLPGHALHRSGAFASRPRRHGRGGQREGRHRHPDRAEASRPADGRQDGHRASLRTWRRPSFQRMGSQTPFAVHRLCAGRRAALRGRLRGRARRLGCGDGCADCPRRDDRTSAPRSGQQTRLRRGQRV